MSIESLLTDRCDIFHLKSEPSNRPKFGVPIENMQQEQEYDDAPDYTNVKSYFAESNQNIMQTLPDNKITSVMKVTFLLGTDIRTNDKIVFGGESYIARKPRNIKNNHIEVKAIRNDSL